MLLDELTLTAPYTSMLHQTIALSTVQNIYKRNTIQYTKL
jgi:hypothetical protein